MKVVSIIGARPQFVKAAVVSRALREDQGVEEFLVHTGQHFDDNMSRVFFDEMGIPEPNVNLGVSGGGHGAMTGSMLTEIEKILGVRNSRTGLLYMAIPIPPWRVPWLPPNSTFLALMSRQVYAPTTVACRRKLIAS